LVMVKVVRNVIKIREVIKFLEITEITIIG